MRVGQAHLMEYMLLTLLVVMIIVMFALFLAGWQVSGMEEEKAKSIEKRALFLTKSFITSPFLNKRGYEEGSMFEDSKLTVLTCDDLERMFGSGWFVEIKLVDNELSTIDCTLDNYPMCGRWEFCKEERNFVAFEVPVNVYRKISDDVNVAIMVVGLYE